MKYDVDYFIQKFEAIPEDLWCMGTLTLGDKHCALGHCGVRNIQTEGSEALLSIFAEASTILKEKGVIKWHLHVAGVNDGGTWATTLFKQNTPRERILAALNYIKDNT